MKLIDDWKAVAGGAWSVRLATVAAMLASLDAFVPVVAGILPPKACAALSALAALGAAVSRVIAQPGLRDR